MPVHPSHWATVPVIVWDRGAVASTSAPMRRCVRIHGSNGSPAPSVQVTYSSIGVSG
jgi:hypothetical protein